MKTGLIFAYLAVALIATSCTTDGQDNNPKIVDKNIESHITISHGIYGLAYSVNDIGNSDEAIIPNFKILINRLPSNSDTSPIDSTATNEAGIYQKELPEGSYTLCTSFMRCDTITLAKRSMRCDYEFSAGPGWMCE